ncbi:MAG: hypothetical protein A2Z97_11800 [Bdellovibrionales bacterium GWB1_52_6]|nr:MAG: hypothetical protein A2Z97_11800 [Bdellovibrionales bacterium GWB1_52_6]
MTALAGSYAYLSFECGMFETKQLRLSMLVLAVLFAAALGVLAFSLYFYLRLTDQLIIANEELKTALATRDNFISTASHELKTPLTSLVLQTQLLRRNMGQAAVKPMPKEYLEKAVELICTQTSRLNLLINDLLDVTRIPKKNKSRLKTSDF